MKWSQVAHTSLTMLLLLICAVPGGLLATGVLEVRWAKGAGWPQEARAQQKEAPHPLPGRLKGTTAFSHADKASRKANASYPAWLRSSYSYTELVGPDVKTGLNANRLLVGTLVLQPRATYPAHNHPAAEVYYVLEGEADWWVDDEREVVRPGSIIYHRPHAVHGWVNRSFEKPFKAVWVWWEEGKGTPEVLRKGARLTNRARDEEERKAQPFAEPLPSEQK